MVFSTDEVLKVIEARTPEALTKLALEFLRRRVKRVALVCGPITTGDRRSPEENRRRLAAVVSALRRKGVVVFDQIVFLRQIEKMRGLPQYQDRAYLREVFHLPLLKSGWVKTIYMAYEWRDSVGARWYHDRAKELGIEVKVVKFPHNSTAAVK